MVNRVKGLFDDPKEDTRDFVQDCISKAGDNNSLDIEEVKKALEGLIDKGESDPDVLMSKVMVNLMTFMLLRADASYQSVKKNFNADPGNLGKEKLLLSTKGFLMGVDFMVGRISELQMLGRVILQEKGLVDE